MRAKGAGEIYLACCGCLCRCGDSGSAAPTDYGRDSFGGENRQRFLSLDGRTFQDVIAHARVRFGVLFIDIVFIDHEAVALIEPD